MLTIFSYSTTLPAARDSRAFLALAEQLETMASMEHDRAWREKAGERAVLEEAADGSMVQIGTAIQRVIISKTCKVHDTLGNIRTLQLGDFPAGYGFGNGLTLGAVVALNTGDTVCLSYACFRDSEWANVTIKWDQIRPLLEGMLPEG